MDSPIDDPAQVVPVEDQLAEMAAMRDEGLITGIGISTATLDQVRLAHETVGLACVQNAYSLLATDDDPVLAFCAAAGIAYVPYFPLGSALPGMPKVTEHPAVVALARERRVSPAQIGLAWLLARSPNVLLIPGTSSVAHLEENRAAGDIKLRAEEIRRIDSDHRVP